MIVCLSSIKDTSIFVDSFLSSVREKAEGHASWKRRGKLKIEEGKRKVNYSPETEEY